MWLWYLELYLACLVTFALGALVGLVLVRLVVRTRAEDFTLGSSLAPGQKGQAAGKSTGQGKS